MAPAIVEFTARGSARALSSAIEAYAAERRVISALVVPWESDERTLRMAVTSSKVDGWAIEHTNLGTISLADLGGEQTRVAVWTAFDHGTADAPGDATSEQTEIRDRQDTMLTSFARQLEKVFGAAAES